MARKRKTTKPTRRKRPWGVDDSESLTGPLVTTRVQRNLRSNAAKKEPSVVVISSTNQETEIIELPLQNMRVQSPAMNLSRSAQDTSDQYNDLKTNMEKVIDVVGKISEVLAMSPHASPAQVQQLLDTTKQLAQAERIKSTESILQKFIQSDTNPSDPSKNDPEKAARKARGLAKKLFKPKDEGPADHYEYNPTLRPVWAPAWLTSMFGVNNVMKLSPVQAAVATYIFKDSKNANEELEEVMVKLEDIDNSVPVLRRNMNCLSPKGWLEDNILNLVVLTLTKYERNITNLPSYWFMPTDFAQFVQCGTHSSDTLASWYRNTFMGYVNYVSQIFIPINDNENHWFLMVVEMYKNQIVVLDSYPNPERTNHRLLDVKSIAVCLEKMLLDESFYTSDITKPKISEFKIVIPDGIGLQKEGSNDCGVWVSEWMMEKGSNEFMIEVDNGTRLNIAIEVSMNSMNTNRDVLLKKALNYMKECKKAQELTKLG